MTREQLLEKLDYFLNPENVITAVLYFALIEDGDTVIKRADIEADTQETLKDRFIQSIHETFILNDGFSFMNISEADDRKNVIYNYDLDERPENLKIINEVLEDGNRPTFQFNQQSLHDLQAYVIVIGDEMNKIALYKKNHPVNLLYQDRFLLVPISNTRFVPVERDAIVIDKHFDFLEIDEELIILRLNTLERFFGYEEVVRAQAQGTLQIIADNELLEDIEPLNALALDLTNAKKLMKIRNSPVLNVPVVNVINFIKNHPELTGRIHFNDDETKISLDTGVSKKLFLKLLNDDYLFSQLTELQYDTYAKDKLDDV